MIIPRTIFFKRELLLIAFIIYFCEIFAYDIKINGIFYNLDGTTNTAEVTKQSFNSYSGEVNIPNIVSANGKTYSVTAIGSQAFYGCKGLSSVTMPATIINIRDYAFSGCSLLTNISIPSSVQTIGDDAFGGCSGLTTLSIPNSVKSIGTSAF